MTSTSSLTPRIAAISRGPRSVRKSEVTYLSSTAWSAFSNCWRHKGIVIKFGCKKKQTAQMDLFSKTARVAVRQEASKKSGALF